MMNFGLKMMMFVLKMVNRMHGPEFIQNRTKQKQ